MNGAGGEGELKQQLDGQKQQGGQNEPNAVARLAPVRAVERENGQSRVAKRNRRAAQNVVGGLGCQKGLQEGLDYGGGDEVEQDEFAHVPDGRVDEKNEVLHWRGCNSGVAMLMKAQRLTERPLFLSPCIKQMFIPEGAWKTVQLQLVVTSSPRQTAAVGRWKGLEGEI